MVMNFLNVVEKEFSEHQIKHINNYSNILLNICHTLSS